MIVVGKAYRITTTEAKTMAQLTITAVELATMLRNHKGCQFASLDYETEPRELYKKANGSRKADAPKCPAVSVRTVGKGIMLGADYSNRVNNQRKREEVAEDFTPQMPNGYTHVQGLYAITSTGAPAMLYSLPKAGTEQDQKGTKTFHDENGDVVTEDKLKGFRKPARQSYGKSQGIEDQIQWRCIKLENILAIRAYGNEYEIDHAIEQPATVTA
jgi:hypothetical protein